MAQTATSVRNGVSAAAAAFAVTTVVCAVDCRIADAAERDEGRGRSVAQQSRHPSPLCQRLLSSQTVKFSGLYPAIEERIALSNFAAGQVVEIDPKTMPHEEARTYISGIKALGARISIYLVGGHCELGADCDRLGKTVRLGPTGSWNWDESERRILSITHPAVLAIFAQGIENGWRLGANYIRIDNLHHPAGATHPRTPAQMKIIIDLGHDIEDRLRADGTIEPDRVTGLVAHNNLVSWARLIEQGKLRRPPAVLTSERTAQLAALPAYEGDARMKSGRLTPLEIPDVQAGRRIAEHFQIPYSIVEFRKAHDLAQRGRSYELPEGYVEAAQRLRGVTEVIVIKDESHYVGRDQVFAGPGPSTLPQLPGPSAPLSTAKACSLMRLQDR